MYLWVCVCVCVWVCNCCRSGLKKCKCIIGLGQTGLLYGNEVHISDCFWCPYNCSAPSHSKERWRYSGVHFLSHRTEVALAIWIIHTLGLVQNVVTSPMWPCLLRELRFIERGETTFSSHARSSASFHELHKFGCIQSRHSSREIIWLNVNRQRVYWKK